MLGLRTGRYWLAVPPRSAPVSRCILRALSTQALRNATLPRSPQQYRYLSTTPSRPYRRSQWQPPRFQGGAPSGPFSQLWRMVPDQAKTVVGLVAGCAALMVVGPLFFFIAPPLFLGGLFMVTRRVKRAKKDMADIHRKLRASELAYDGTELEMDKLEKFAEARVTDALEVDEQGIIKTLGIEQNTRVSLTPAESYDKSLVPNDDLSVIHSVTMLSYGLIDKTSTSRFNRIGTVKVAFMTSMPTMINPNHHRDQPCIIEVLPLRPFSKPVLLDTPSRGSTSGRIIDIKARRTTRYQ